MGHAAPERCIPQQAVEMERAEKPAPGLMQSMRSMNGNDIEERIAGPISGVRKNEIIPLRNVAARPPGNAPFCGYPS